MKIAACQNQFPIPENFISDGFRISLRLGPIALRVLQV
jgi:hypothetical protein